MSVYFYPHPIPETAQYLLRFWCDRPEELVAAADRLAIAAEHNESCDECASYQGVLVDGNHQWPQINISYGNAARVMGMLGFEGDDIHGGHATADDFLGRLLVADGLLETSDARPSSVTRGANGATLIDCGERAGYVNDKIRSLISLAMWAKEHGSDIVWN